MRKYVFLISNDIKMNIKKRLGIIICISLFLTAFLAVIWYNDSFHYYLSHTVNDNYELQNRIRISDFILVPVTISFVLTSVIGIISAIVYSFKQQEKKFRLLRCIGFSKHKIGAFLIIQEFLIWLCSILLAVFFAFVMVLFIGYVSGIDCRFELFPLIAAALMSFFCIVITNTVLLNIFYRHSPLRDKIYIPRHKRKSVFTLKKCWHKSFSRKFRVQNSISILLIFLCTTITVIGSFLPLFNARGTTWNDPDRAGDTDYALFIGAGNTSSEEYFIQFPTGQGIDRNKADDIIKRYDLEVKNNEGGSLFQPFFLTSKQGDNALLKHHIELEKNDELYQFSFESPLTDKMINIAGGNLKTDIIGTMHIYWMSEKTLKSKYTLNGNFRLEKFLSGDEIIAPDKYCKTGDHFRILIPVFDADTTSENVRERLKFICKTMTVSSIYHSDSENAPLIFSQDFLFSVNDILNYERLDLFVSKHLSDAEKKSLEKELQSLADVSSTLKYLNYDKIRAEFYYQVNTQTSQLAVSTGFFIIILLIAVMMSAFVQIHSNRESYHLLRIIGADNNTVIVLVRCEFMRLLKIGIISGTVFGIAVDLFFSLIGGIQTWDIFLRYVLPLSSVAIFILYFAVSVSVKRVLRKWNEIFIVD